MPKDLPIRIRQNDKLNLSNSKSNTAIFRRNLNIPFIMSDEIFNLYFNKNFIYQKNKFAACRKKMINALQIREILSLYRKHGWSLRRVLLSRALQENLSDEIETLFDATEIAASEIDAVWFSRASGARREAWEIRHLSKTPFAMIEVFDADVEEDVRAGMLKNLEARLTERLQLKK